MIVVGGGPGGSSCAAFCAAAGLKTIILDRAKFPREKVCGDCLNPECWPILERMGVAARVSALPHAVLEKVEFISVSGFRLKYPLPVGPHPEIAVQRFHFDHVLLTRAAELGAEIRDGAAVTSLDYQWGGNEGRWEIRTTAGSVNGRRLVAADGRNSTVARLLGLLPPPRPDRVGWQTHFPIPAAMSTSVAMRFLPSGYCGVADVGGGTANLCLVARPSRISELKAWASENFDLSLNQPWRTITPLDRAAIRPVQRGVFLVGDAARVVEPFTGEGIYYALASGELAARHLAENDDAGYERRHARLYRGRLWINGLARFACLHPSFAEGALQVARRYPRALEMLTRKVVNGVSPLFTLTPEKRQ